MKRYIVPLLFMLFCSSLAAQNLTVEAPRVVSMNETFRIVFTANGNMSDFEWPGTSDFDVVWGPQKGSMSSTNIINGKRESSHTETYTYLLQPKAEGKFTLPGATATVDKKDCSTASFTIEVVKAQQQQQSSSSSSSSSSAQQGSSGAIQSGTVSNDDIFLRLSLSKSNVVKGEPITATLKLYYRTDISGIEDITFPSFNGFWNKETFTAQTIESNRENVDGTIYNVALLKRYMLIPQQEGRLTIDPAEMICLVRVRTSGGFGRSIFDEFFDNYQTIRKRVSSGSAYVNVTPLPGGAPSSFEGGVGQFKITADLSSDSLKTNDAGSLKVTISGNGNISMLGAPKVAFPPDFEVYDVKSTENISNDGASGSKTFEYPFIPRSYGNYEIGPINYSYYDVSLGRYVTISAPVMSLGVAASAEDASAGSIVPGVARQGVRNIGEDIRYIATGRDNLRKEGRFFVSSPAFYILLALLAALFFIVDKVTAVSRARRADVVGSKNRKANKVAVARLRQAGDYLSKGLDTAFYEELHKAVTGYVCDKLMMAPADYTKENARERLVEQGVTPELADSFVEIIDGCEMARYAPESNPEAMDNLYKNAMSVISRIESSIRNASSGRKGAAAKAATSLLLLLALGFGASAQDWNAANELYAQGNYTTALDSYLAIEQSDLVSADLYYNIGNCYYKLADIPHAVLYYKRALKLNPHHADALNNLEIAQASVQDRIESVPRFILAEWLDNFKYSMSSDGWAWLTVALFVLVLLLLTGFRQFGSRSARKASFVLACVLFVLTLCSFSLALSQRADAVSDGGAVVMSPVSSVKSSPGASGTSLFIIHEGTVLEVKDVVGDWYRVTIADGREGWIPAADIEII
ncbi:MAG: BatD family protein [Bacteroidales bacterium]|nr:BatD family protein [Bacteroidales bacterium]